MSDTAIDNTSLPSDDVTTAESPQTLIKRRLPYGTLRANDEDELLTTAGVLQTIQSSHGRHHRLDLSHAYLQDVKANKVLDVLRERSSSPGINDHLLFHRSDDGSEFPNQDQWLRSIPSLSRAMMTNPTPLCASFRIVELDNNSLTFACLPAICRLLDDNLTLHKLSLKANQIEGEPRWFYILAQAIGSSALRHLCLSSNPIGPYSLAAFFDSIPEGGTALETLEMSNLSRRFREDEFDEDTSTETIEGEYYVAAQAAADFIGDPKRCRSLRVLHLNANSFGSRGVRVIDSALVGSLSDAPGLPIIQTDEITALSDQLQALRGDPFYLAVFGTKPMRRNRSLVRLQLSGNYYRCWQAEDPQKDLNKFLGIKRRYAAIPTQEVKTMAVFIEQWSRQKRMQQKEDPSEVFFELPFEVSRHLFKLDATLNDVERDFQDAAQFAAGLDGTTLIKMRLSCLDANVTEGKLCRKAAARILSVARTVGYRVRRASTTADPQTEIVQNSATPGFPRFMDLPPELRLLIVRHLDEDNILSGSQFANIISYACEPSTIGYGQPQYDWSRILESASKAESSSAEGPSSTRPAQGWSWRECFASRAPPRDWQADLLDASNEESELRPRAVKGRWSLERTSPSTFAFLESTLTHRTM